MSPTSDRNTYQQFERSEYEVENDCVLNFTFSGKFMFIHSPSFLSFLFSVIFYYGFCKFKGLREWVELFFLLRARAELSHLLLSGSWLLPNLKAQRRWEAAERRRGRGSSWKLPGFDHSSILFTRWNNLLQETAERLRASKALLQLWQRYKDCYQQCSSTVRQREEQTNELLKTVTSKDIADDEVTAWIRDCNVCSVKLCSFSQLCRLKFTRVSPLLNSTLGVLETCMQTHFLFLRYLRHRRGSFTSATQISWASHNFDMISTCCGVVSEAGIWSLLSEEGG